MRRREFIVGLCSASACSKAAFAQRASEGRQYRISYLALAPGEDGTLMNDFSERLRELGLVRGHNLTLVYRSAEGRPERLSHLANELLESHPDVLVAGFGTLAAKAAKEATTTVPVIFGDVGDPVGAGLVASLNRPGGNVTGLSTQGADLAGKRLQLLQEVSGAAKIFGVLLNPQTPLAALALDQLRAAAEKAGTDLKVFEITAGDQLVSQVEAAANAGVAALMAVDDPLMMSLVAQLAQLAQKHRLPTLSSTRVFTEAGGLISYGPDRRKAFRRAAEYAYRIISGMNPADLAVEQPTMFEMVINLKTAATLGVTIPPTLLARADEVIE